MVGQGGGAAHVWPLAAGPLDEAFNIQRYQLIPAPLPHNEKQRLAALRNLRILDTPPEERFDRIAAFAAQGFGVPMALDSMVDRDRQWFKSNFGLEARETPRDISFCGHAVTLSAPLVVPDALEDPRFADNPLVTGAPYVRFYAGAGLRLPYGEVVGTLCVMDSRPRVFDRLDVAVLCGVRDLVVEELLRREEVHP
jgi:GAF domain-containing protein